MITKKLTAQEAALYLGQEVAHNIKGVETLIGIHYIQQHDQYGLQFKGKRNLGFIQSYKLLLRPISDITDEEFRELGVVLFEELTTNFYTERDSYCVKISDDTDEGFCLTIYNNGSMDFICYDNHETYSYPIGQVISYLTSKGFDLFGYIEQGLAIDKTKLPTT
jgi:hypothetical protein